MQAMSAQGGSWGLDGRLSRRARHRMSQHTPHGAPAEVVGPEGSQGQRPAWVLHSPVLAHLHHPLSCSLTFH